MKKLCVKYARCWIAIWGLRSAGIKKLKKTDPHYFSKKLGSVFFNIFIQALLRPQIVIWGRATILCVWKIYFWENDKILITLALYVRFWSLRYLWKLLCEGIQDFRLSHTFTHSFLHFHTQNHNIWKDFKVIAISGCSTIYSVDTWKKLNFGSNIGILWIKVYINVFWFYWKRQENPSCHQDVKYQDIRLSHTFTHSFSHFHIQNQNIWKDFKVITISGCLTIYSVDTF